METIDLPTLGNIAEIIGAGSILMGLIFGSFQIRQYRVQQRDAIAMNLAQTFYSHDLPHAISLLVTVPDGIRLVDLRARGPEYEDAAITLTTSFETMGLLTYKRIAPLDLVLDLAGGIVATMTRKLSNWLNDLREEQNQPSFGEWFDWLGDRAREAKLDSAPAHQLHRNWKP